MAGLTPLTLAVLWAAAMVIACGLACFAVLRRVPPLPGPRLFALIGVEAIGLVFIAVAALVTFAWPDAIGLPSGEMSPFLVVMMSFVVLVMVLTVTIFLVPAIRRGAAQAPGGTPPVTRR